MSFSKHILKLSIAAGLIALPAYASLTGGATLDAKTPLAPELLHASALQPEVRDFESQLAVLVGNNDADAMASLLLQLEAGSDVSRLVRSRLRYVTLMSFARVTETAWARTQIEPYLRSKPDVYTWHEEGFHRVAVPAFDPAAAAAYALSAWNKLTWHSRAARALRNGSGDFLDDWLAAHEASGGRLAADGLVSAFAQASTEDLAGWPGRLGMLLRQGEPVAELARVVALRLGNRQLAAALIDDADTLSALRFMDDFTSQADAGSATQLLERALRREDLASPALYRLGRLESHEARALLLRQLASPEHGGSAAAALARNIGPELIDSLASLVRSDPDMLTRRRAVLALGLARESGGHRALAALRTDAGLPDELHRLLARQLP